MIAVGVRNLKDQLSHYLQYVKDGEKIVVTEHNRIIAEILAPEKKEKNTDIEQKFEQLRKDGRMLLSKRNVSLVQKPKLTEIEKNIDWELTYNEIRSDRF